MDENTNKVFFSDLDINETECNRIAERVYKMKCVGSRSVDQLRKMWIDLMNDYL